MAGPATPPAEPSRLADSTPTTDSSNAGIGFSSASSSLPLTPLYGRAAMNADKKSSPFKASRDLMAHSSPHNHPKMLSV
jgi:hypothetical protein